jgi:hypothetical protein
MPLPKCGIDAFEAALLLRVLTDVCRFLQE